ncbi:MAG: GAF domain-containing protein [Chloroflexia bacterium]
MQGHAQDRDAREPQPDTKAFWDESAEAVSSVIPHFKVPCWFTLDPASLLVTSHYDHGLIPEFLRSGSRASTTMTTSRHRRRRSERGISTLHEAAGGDPSGSPRWQRNMEIGGDQELLVALRTPTGEAWGLLALYREPGQPQFQADELEFLRIVAPLLAQGARQALLLGEASEPEGPEPPGLVVLNEDWSIDSLTPGAERCSASCRTATGKIRTGHLRCSPSPVALFDGRGRARGRRGRRFPRPLGEGRWMILHGAALVAGGGGRRVAVIVEPAHPARITPLLMAAYNLTDREQEVTCLVLCGD